MRSGKAILIFILGVLPFFGSSQEAANSLEVERKSYELFAQQNWDGLIDFAGVALLEGFDYFYLRYRLGVAYYNKEQYRLAVVQFRKAFSFNADDSYTQEYLYYSLLFAGQTDEARSFSQRFGIDLNEKMKLKNTSPFNFISVDGGAKIPNNPAYKAAGFFQVNLSHTIANKFSLLHAVTTYNQAESRGIISQWEYFIQASIPLGKGWTFAPSFHSVNLNFESATVPNTFKYSDFVVSAALSKSFPHANVSVGGGYSSVLTQPQYLQFGTIAIYPTAKSNFSIGTTVYTHQYNAAGGNTSAFNLPTTIAINPFVYWAVSPRVSVYVNYFKNSNYNISEFNGFLVNNSQDVTTARFGGTLNIALSRHWDLYASYLQEEKQATTFQYLYSTTLVGLKFKPL